MKYLILLFALLSFNAHADDYLIRYERTVLSEAQCDKEPGQFKATENDAHGTIERGCWYELNGFYIITIDGKTEQYPTYTFEQATEDDL